MTRKIRILSATTALAVALGSVPALLSAQPYEQLSGVMVPQCDGEGEPVDAGTLEAEAFGTEQPPAPGLVRAANKQGEVCIDADGQLELSGRFARVLGMTVSPSDPASGAAPADASDLANILRETETEPAAPAEPEAEATVDADAPATPEAPDQDVAARPAETEPAEAEPQQETVQVPAPEPAPEPEPQQETVQVPAPAPAPEPEPQQETVQAPAPEPAPEPEPDQPVAAAASADDGRDSEPAQVSETTVTEENSRSSSEEFANPQANANANANAGSSGGLSTLEKFAIGAAGIVALDAILGRDSQVISNTGDRVVVRRGDGDLEVLRDDDTLLRRPGSDVRTETFSDGSTRTTVTRSDGSKIVTIADASGRVIKRTRTTADGQEIVLIDDIDTDVRPVDVSRLPPPEPERNYVETTNRAALEAALRAQSRAEIDRRFTLRQVREYREVRSLMPEINIDAINFATGSAAIQPEEAEELFELGQVMSSFISENPDELFLIEGHTDAVGDAAYNLALSDRRAESVALALTEYFDVPPENMIIQGYGESELLVPTAQAERANRRAVVRRVTPLLR